jgi:hypothetical protein
MVLVALSALLQSLEHLVNESRYRQGNPIFTAR